VNYPANVRELAKREGKGLFCVQLVDENGRKSTMYGPSTREFRIRLQRFAKHLIVQEMRKA
jgi:phage protein U